MGRAILRVSPQYIIDMSKGEGVVRGFTVSKNGLPDDAHLVGMWLSGPEAAVELVVESDSFPNLPEGEKLPELPSVEYRLLDRYELMKSEHARESEREMLAGYRGDNN